MASRKDPSHRLQQNATPTVFTATMAIPMGHAIAPAVPFVFGSPLSPVISWNLMPQVAPKPPSKSRQCRPHGKEKSVLASRVSGVVNLHKELEKERIATEERMEKLVSANKVLQAKVDALTLDLATEKKSKDIAVSESQWFARRMDRQSQTVESLQSKLRSMKDSMADLKRSKKESKMERNELASTITKLQGELTAAEAYAQEHRDAADAAIARVSHLEVENRAVAKDLVRSRRQVEHLRNKISSKGEKLQSTRTDLEDTQALLVVELERKRLREDELLECNKKLKLTQNENVRITRLKERVYKDRRKLRQDLRKEKASKQRIVNKMKNRGRAIKKLAIQKENFSVRLKEESLDRFKSQGTRPLKPFADLSNRQQDRRKKQIKAAHEDYFNFINDVWQFSVPDYGTMQVIATVGREGLSSVEMKKAASNEERVLKFVALRDTHYLSKRKLHEVHMLAPEAIPATSAMKVVEDKLKDEILKALTVHVEPDKSGVHVGCKEWLAHIISKKKLGSLLSKDGKVDLFVEGDGRGTGNSFHSVILQFRILQEGRKLFKREAQYVLCYVTGDEKHEKLKKNLKYTLDGLQDLQTTGLDVPDPDDPRKSVHLDVVLHLLADKKFQSVTGGLIRSCDRGENCTSCWTHSDKRYSTIDKGHIKKVANRYAGIGKHGQKREDLFHFIPATRRYTEFMHLCMRFGHDKLILSAFTEIITCEAQSEGKGMRMIEEAMRGGKINLSSFQFFMSTDSKDNTSSGKWSYKSLSYCSVLKVLQHFPFASMYRKSHAKRGEWMEKRIREFHALYSSLNVWPGDGPSLSMKQIYEKHSKFMKALVKPSSGLPGSRSFAKVGLPQSVVTPYAHDFVHHVAEDYQTSKKFAKFFTKGVRGEGKHGGCKIFRTDALERANLHFMHQYYQCAARRGDVLEECFYKELRRFFNPESVDRSKYSCDYCARKFTYEKRWLSHMKNDCAQRPLQAHKQLELYHEDETRAKLEKIKVK